MEVTLDHETIEITMKNDKQTILDAVENAGFDPPFSCRGGVCCSCKAKIIEGEATMRLNYSLTDEEVKNGYILTSDSNGVSTWQEGVTKFSATFSFGANATQSITHNLNSSAIIFNFWNEDTGGTEVVNISKTGLNTIDVMSTVAVVNGRVVIIS